MVSLNHGHLYLLLGRRLRVGGDDHVYPGITSNPGKGRGMREDSGTRRNVCGKFFFTSSGFLTVTSFDKRRNNKKINHT